MLKQRLQASCLSQTVGVWASSQTYDQPFILLDSELLVCYFDDERPCVSTGALRNAASSSIYEDSSAQVRGCRQAGLGLGLASTRKPCLGGGGSVSGK